jgi:hypothetical protein
MAVMDVMQTAIHQVVDMITVGHGFMTAIGSMDVVGPMAAALAMGAVIRVGGIDLQDVLVHVIAMHVVQMAVVQIVDMASVLDGGMATVRTVLVAVMRVMPVVAGGHGVTPEKVAV